MTLPADLDLRWVALLIALVIFSGWEMYEHHRVEQKFRLQSQATQAGLARLLSNMQQADSQLLHGHPYAPVEHTHAELSPLLHDHTGGPQGHVHLLKYASTEITDGKRRDVYTCLVPDCHMLVGHQPEA